MRSRVYYTLVSSLTVGANFALLGANAQSGRVWLAAVNAVGAVGALALWARAARYNDLTDKLREQRRQPR